MQEGFKFTDRDLRENNGLVDSAIQYVMGYTGDFDLVVAARQLYIETNTLPIQVARAVLNTAIADPRAHLGNQVPVRPSRDKVVIPFPQRMKPPSREKPRYPFRVKATYHTPYIWSNEKIASVYHRIWQAKSYVEYRPSTGTFLLSVRARCVWQISWEWSLDQERAQSWRSTRCTVGMTPPDRRACKMCETKCADDDLST